MAMRWGVDHFSRVAWQICGAGSGTTGGVLLHGGSREEACGHGSAASHEAGTAS